MELQEHCEEFGMRVQESHMIILQLKIGSGPDRRFPGVRYAYTCQAERTLSGWGGQKSRGAWRDSAKGPCIGLKYYAMNTITTAIHTAGAYL